MLFRNFTPFDAMEFAGVDTKDREYDVFAMAVGYTLRPSTAGGAPPGDHVPVIQDRAPVALCLGDDHYGEEGESRLTAPKPR